MNNEFHLFSRLFHSKYARLSIESRPDRYINELYNEDIISKNTLLKLFAYFNLNNMCSHSAVFYSFHSSFLHDFLSRSHLPSPSSTFS